MNLCRSRICRGFSTFLFSQQAILNGQAHRNISHLCRLYSPIIACNYFGRVHHFSTESIYKSSKNAKEKSKLILKTPKGTCDHSPQKMALRQKVFGKIESIFQTHGAQAIDTPVFELKEVLTGKYGEESKLIYDIADQGGEILALRYDLTVPFARYLAMNKISTMKRYQIGKVYRRDTPSITQGRLREFYQCDFDIVGFHDSMLQEIECMKVMSEIINSLDIGKFVIRLNHRQLLNGLFEACGVQQDKFQTICSAVDKLDKSPWSEVRCEMVEGKGLSEEVADRVGEYTQLSGHTELVDRLLQDEHLNKVPSIVKGLEELKLLLDYCSLLELQDNVIIDLSLARGLDYYTGIIFEAVLKDTNSSNLSKSIGSIAAGGRYDDLIGIFDAKGNSVPCVGVSFGVERIFTVLEAKNAEDFRTNNKFVDVYVVSAHKGLHKERLKIVNKLWNAGIRTEHSYKENPRILHQLQHCEKHKIPYAVVIGDSELERDVVKLRTISTREELEIPMAELEFEIKNRTADIK